MNTVKLQNDNTRSGVKFNTLFEDSRETVRLEKWEAGASVTIDTSGGAELLVLDGAFTQAGDIVDKLSWLRIPMNGDFQSMAGANGARVWIKTGHLRYAEEEKQRLT